MWCHKCGKQKGQDYPFETIVLCTCDSITGSEIYHYDIKQRRHLKVETAAESGQAVSGSVGYSDHRSPSASPRVVARPQFRPQQPSESLDSIDRDLEEAEWRSHLPGSRDWYSIFLVERDAAEARIEAAFNMFSTLAGKYKDDSGEERRRIRKRARARAVVLDSEKRWMFDTEDAVTRAEVEAWADLQASSEPASRTSTKNQAKRNKCELETKFFGTLRDSWRAYGQTYGQTLVQNVKSTETVARQGVLADDHPRFNPTNPVTSRDPEVSSKTRSSQFDGKNEDMRNVIDKLTTENKRLLKTIRERYAASSAPYTSHGQDEISRTQPGLLHEKIDAVTSAVEAFQRLITPMKQDRDSSDFADQMKMDHLEQAKDLLGRNGLRRSQALASSRKIRSPRQKGHRGTKAVSTAASKGPVQGSYTISQDWTGSAKDVEARKLHVLFQKEFAFEQCPTKRRRVN